MKKINQKKLNELRDLIISDKVGSSLADTATQLVFGEGKENAKIVFIGEAPGKNEDISGQPFVGAAGKFLETMLQSIGLSREEVYITNIVKYRPPNNRDPLPEEKREFLPYLYSQLAIIQPKLVVTLGRHSTNCFLPGMQISNIHGQPKRIRIKYSDKVAVIADKIGQKLADTQQVELTILPLFHPAAALYNGGMRQTLINDFSAIPDIIKLLENDKKPN